ncbi:hypothetical protein NM688_g8047 [Phlebia brevispora]|uniref:Uncharacterized protein n=1 Tax=Phlebia brevispora TaxID=194682 RepID=A0ACC1RXZ5_9APHY|nr:hypothetical protein NM688_g8047 [Phlebia brevispora]
MLFVRLLSTVPSLIVAGTFLRVYTSGSPLSIPPAVSALRVFALLGRAFGPAAFTFALGLVSFSLNIVSPSTRIVRPLSACAINTLSLSQYLDSKRVYYHVDDPVLGSSCFFDYLVSPSAAFK